MKRVGLAALLLAGSPLLIGCSSDPTCGDVDSLQQKLDGMGTDDPDYNTTVEKLNQAQAACNSGSGY
jgi:outer membrane murein-binding lipoprotein Lpp